MELIGSIQEAVKEGFYRTPWGDIEFVFWGHNHNFIKSVDGKYDLYVRPDKTFALRNNKRMVWVYVGGPQPSVYKPLDSNARKLMDTEHELALLHNTYKLYPGAWCCNRARSSNGWGHNENCKNWVLCF